MQQSINELGGSILSKEQSLQAKSQRIEELTKSNQQLERLKYILEQKIAEQKQQRVPREEEIL